MDAVDVLREYLELFNCDCRQLKLLVAPNAVVDWFGRSIRGPAKIHDYLRFEINPHYEHVNFDKAEACEPIEQRPSHWKTKILPNGDVDFVQPRNKVSGLASLKSYADSDLDDDDLDMQPLPKGNQTPEHTTEGMHTTCELTPPASTSKCATATLAEDSDANERDEDDVDEFGASKPKRLKRTQSSPFSYLRRLPVNAPITKVSKRQPIGDFGMQMLGDDTSSDEEMDADYKEKVANEFTPLRYMQATGTLCSKMQTLDTPPTSHALGGWERPVRLRISYRRRISDQQLQIALVIYEHIDEATGKTNNRRRNLMAQFNEAAAVSGVDDVSAETQEVATVPLTVTETLVATGVTTGLEELEETTAFSIVPLRTPTKSMHTPPATPKRRPRVPYAMSGMKRINLSPSTSSTTTPPAKRSAARSLRL